MWLPSQFQDVDVLTDAKAAPSATIETVCLWL
jgi:hypothetical protein